MIRNGHSSVVIVSYRPGDWLEPCIRSVIDQTDEVIVVDNGSTNGLASAVAARSRVTVVRSHRNLGFAGGVNLGMSKATGSVVALLNDDASAPAGWVAAATRVLEDESIAAVGPKVLLSGWFREVVLPDRVWHAPGDERRLGRQIRSVRVDGEEVLGRLVGPGLHRLEVQGGDRWRWTAGPLPFYVPVRETGLSVTVDGDSAPPGQLCRVTNSAGIYLRADGYAGDIGIGSADDGRWDGGADRFGVSFTAVAFRRATWDRLGPLARRYFAYYEDVDWCWRAQLAGLRIRYDPSIAVSHLWSATSGGATAAGVRVLSESNRSLTIVRNAPRPLVVKHLRERWREVSGRSGRSDDGVGVRLARRLPWALATRARIQRRIWSSGPEEVWSAWAGRGVEWSVAPAGMV